MARHAKDLQLVLHVGLHKTASTYIQNVLSARRYDLIPYGILYPSTGMFEEARVRTREGAQSGHFRLTFRNGRKALLNELLNEVPVSVSTVLLSAEDFTHPRLSAEQHFDHLSGFGSIKVVAVVRRQDTWIESIYKQAVDQWGNFETRSFGEYLVEEGPGLLDFHSRLSPWRDLVGPENFHVLSYDDLAGAEMCRRILRVAGVPAEDLDGFPGVEVPRYVSVRGIDTLGLRILNGYRIQTRDVRNKIAREIFAAAPRGDVELMTPDMRAGIEERYAPVNRRIEEEWLSEPAPRFRFGADLDAREVQPPSSQDLMDYLDEVISLCNTARELDDGATG